MTSCSRDGFAAGLRRAIGVLGTRPRTAGVAGLLICVAALASAPSALALNNYTWSGAGVGDGWSNANNWNELSAPFYQAGTVTFGDMPACDSGASGTDCYVTDDDVSPLTANQVVVDDDQAYKFTSEVQYNQPYALTLDGAGSPAVGLVASPSESTTDQYSGIPDFQIPVVLGADQTWDVDGGTTGENGIEVDTVSGDQTLALDLTNGGTLYGETINTGALTVSGDGTGALVMSQPSVDAPAGLPPAGTTLDSGAALDIESRTIAGDISTSNSDDDHQPDLYVGSGESPDEATLVAGDVHLDPWANIGFDLDSDLTNVPGDSFSQLAAGSVEFDDATLYLEQGLDVNSDDGCATLPAGHSFPVITTTGSMTGDLTYFDTSGNLEQLAPGATSTPVTLGTDYSDCSNSATAVITYGTNTITATVVTAPAPGEEEPTISGTPVAGQTLSVTGNGSWTGSLTPTYSYQWLLCSSSCSPISGATGSTFTLTGADDGDRIEVQVTATNSLGSANADSNALGPVTAAPTTPAPTSTLPAPTVTAPSTSQITSALGGLAHPSGEKAITALLKSGSFKSGFKAPGAGSLSVAWTTTVITGTGKHKRHKTVTIGTGTAHAGESGTVQLTIHLTGTGKTLLKKRRSGVSTTATEKFEPSGGSWASLTKKFNL